MLGGPNSGPTPPQACIRLPQTTVTHQFFRFVVQLARQARKPFGGHSGITSLESPITNYPPPMHIGVIAPPESFHTQKWVSGLRAAGADVTTFSFTPGQVPGVTAVQVVPRFTRGGKLSYLSYLCSGDRLRTALRAHRVDLVTPLNVTPFGVWAWRAGVHPLVSIAMGADVLEYPPQATTAVNHLRRWESDGQEPEGIKALMQRAKWHAFRHLVRRTLHRSALITGDNLQLVHAVRDWFEVPAERVQLNRWGIEPELFQPDPAIQAQLRQRLNLRPGQPLVLSPRGVKPVYQADVVLDAAEQLIAEEQLSFKLVVMGTGYDAPAHLDRQARRLKRQSPHFHYQTELLPREWMPQLWLMTDAFINIPAYDGFSNALNEGRYAGAIPLVNDIPAHREVLQPDGHARFINPLTPATLAQALLDLLPQLSFLKAHFAQSNRQWVEQNAVLALNMQRLVRAMESLA